MDIPDSIEIIESIFQTILEKNIEIQTNLDAMTAKKDGLLNLYKHIIEENMTIVNTLDIFHFQIKMLGNDLVYLTTKYKLTNNRIYCQYFKLYNNIQDFIEQNIPTILQTIPKGSFPTYDDTNPNKVYEFKIISDIHTAICLSLRSILDFLRIRNLEYKKYKHINSSGVYIDVFVETFKHKVRVLIDKTTLFSDILKFYNTTNVNNYTKLLNTIDFTNQNVCNDISFGDLSTMTQETQPGSPIVLDVISLSGDPEGTEDKVEDKDERESTAVPPPEELSSEKEDTASNSGSVKVLKHFFDSIDNNNI
jgi:hypothetical protein